MLGVKGCGVLQVELLTWRDATAATRQVKNAPKAMLTVPNYSKQLKRQQANQ